METVKVYILKVQGYWPRGGRASQSNPHLKPLCHSTHSMGITMYAR